MTTVGGEGGGCKSDYKDCFRSQKRERKIDMCNKRISKQRNREPLLLNVLYDSKTSCNQ